MQFSWSGPTRQPVPQPRPLTPRATAAHTTALSSHPSLDPSRGGQMALDPLDVLRAVPLFHQVPEADLVALARLVRERRQPKGSMILSQGDRVTPSS